MSLDGIVLGSFESYELKGKVAVFKRGYLPPGGFVADWRVVDAQNSIVAEKHDVLVMKLNGNGRAPDALVELASSKLVNIDGSPSFDDGGCLIVDQLVIQVGEVIQPSGTLAALPLRR